LSDMFLQFYRIANLLTLTKKTNDIILNK
jgi:hypothetical protein